MLYYCIGCQSAFFCHEPRVGSSLAWHLKVRERNLSWSKELYDALGKVAILDSIIDIGCGIGTWLDYAKSRGSSVLGFETAQELVVYGENEYNLNLKCELFASSNQSANKQEATLITSIEVFEHLEEPRALAQEIAAYCKNHDAKAYIAVPFFNEKQHSHINYGPSRLNYNVFFDVGAHVMYFSDKGMIKMFGDFNMIPVKDAYSAGGWRGFLFGSADSQSKCNRHPVEHTS